VCRQALSGFEKILGQDHIHPGDDPRTRNAAQEAGKPGGGDSETSTSVEWARESTRSGSPVHP
jgi:hypothetical protein